jgi:hypothetical protein
VTKATLGGCAIRRAVTRVKPEQASKVTMRMPTLLPFGEGRVSGRSNRHEHPARSAGVVGTARRKGGSGNWGRPVMGEGSGLNVASRRRSWRESDRVVGALRLGNASGAKGPDFWCAFEDGEVVVIGDEPVNTIKRQAPSETAVSRGERTVTRRAEAACGLVSLRVPHGEASRKAECRKSARSV